MQNNFRPIIILTMCVAIAACAANTHWSKSGANNAQMLKDLSQCRYLATNKVEKEYQLNQEAIRHDSSGSGEQFHAQMMAFSATKRRKKLIEHCMQQAGYQKIKGK